MGRIASCGCTRNDRITLDLVSCSESFTILGLWVLGLAVSNINESQLQTYESKPLFLMTSLQYYCIPGLAGTCWNKNLCAKDAGCAGNRITAHVIRCSWRSHSTWSDPSAQVTKVKMCMYWFLILAFLTFLLTWVPTGKKYSIVYCAILSEQIVVGCLLIVSTQPIVTSLWNIGQPSWWSIIKKT